MSKFIFLYFAACLGAMGSFFLKFDSPWLVGLISGVPHWPLMLLRFIKVGTWLEQPFIWAADTLLRVVGAQRWILAVLFLIIGFVLGIVAIALEESERSPALVLAATSALALVTVVGAPALLSGLYISRAAELLQKERNADSERALLNDLALADAATGETGGRVVLSRMKRINGELQLLLPDEAADREIVARMRRIEAGLDNLQTSIAKAPKEAQLIQVVLRSVALSIRVVAFTEAYRAEHGRGGRPDQPWRELNFKGPDKNRIVVRTRFLPPPRTNLPVLPGASESGRRGVRERFTKGVREIPDRDWRDLLSQFESEPFVSLDPRDKLFESWYGTISNYYFNRRLLREGFGLEPAGVDSYGELTIVIHNSAESYRAEAGSNVSRGASGIFDRQHNTIQVLEDEPRAQTAEARSLLLGLAVGLENLKIDKDDVPLQMMVEEAFQAPDAGVPYEHELTHWMVHLALPGVPQDNSAASQCVHEGVALALDEARARLLGRYAASLGIHGDASLAQAQWLQERSTGPHAAKGPVELLTLPEAGFKELVKTNARQTYADCWVVAMTLGKRILEEARRDRVSIHKVVTEKMPHEMTWKDLEDTLNSPNAVAR
jgi:hypothetical protein